MYGTRFSPFGDCWQFFSSFFYEPFSGRCFYTRKERIEHLETIRRRLQNEIAAIDEMIADLKARDAGKA